ncbi:MAG: ATP-binding protein [Streptosporangiaceae bacterium]
MVREHPRPGVPGEAVSCLQLGAQPSAAFWARRHTGTALRAWELCDEDIETAQLLISELVTNAVKFSGSAVAGEPGSGPTDAMAISLALRYCADHLIIEVRDPYPTPPVLAQAGTEAEDGRGLMLVQALAKEWSYYLPSSQG